MTRKHLPVLALALAATACDPYIYQNSVAPPGRTGRLDPVSGFWTLKHYRLEVSQGIALALTCADAGPCEKLQVRSDDPQIAEVRLASLAQLQTTGYGLEPPQQPASAFVVIGKAPGTTWVRVTAREGKRDIVVTVAPPPATARAMTAVTPPATAEADRASADLHAAARDERPGH